MWTKRWTKSRPPIRPKASGKDGEPPAALQAIDGEVAAVDGKDGPKAVALGDANQGRVGKVHWQIGILLHQFANPRHVLLVEREKLDCRPFDELPDRRRPAPNVAHLVHGFRQDGPHRSEALANSGEAVRAGPLGAGVGVDESNEGACVYEDHRGGRRAFSTRRTFFPTSVERSGSPPRTEPRRSLTRSCGRTAACRSSFSTRAAIASRTRAERVVPRRTASRAIRRLV